ncbi:MAG: hypothetical protein KGD67_12875 [Candidatus Lokiarchaeota archaeon]|nr:hypothetical protein [Candidatus Lokiarchaeota archaeon]
MNRKLKKLYKKYKKKFNKLMGTPIIKAEDYEKFKSKVKQLYIKMSYI